MPVGPSPDRPERDDDASEAPRATYDANETTDNGKNVDEHPE
jgi:hypothetical protein